jgi:hypothetical protein
MNQDPDGISFFTSAGDPSRGQSSRTSVFGAVPPERLDQMLRIDGAEEIGSPYLPEADEVPTTELAASVLNPVHPRATVPGLPALALGTDEWRRDFILNGPAHVQVGTARVARRLPRQMTMRGRVHGQNAMSEAPPGADPIAGKGDA